MDDFFYDSFQLQNQLVITCPCSFAPAVGISDISLLLPGRFFSMADGADAVDLENWMSQLPDRIRRERSICELALPGAHNAGANSVECIPSTTLAPYMGETLAKSSVIQMLARPIASGPARCQSENVSTLLRRGIRFLDLRLGLHQDEIRICHTVVCSTTYQTVLSEIRDFLENHPEELVVLLIKRDWEHKYFDTAHNWSSVQEMLIEELAGMLMLGDDMKQPISQLVKENRRVLAMLEMRNGEHLCGVLATSRNLKCSWSSEVITVADQMKQIKSWCSDGMILPQPGCLKLLELAIPGVPYFSAPKMQAAFREFLNDTTLHVATKIDFPETETIQKLVQMNWIPRS